MSASAVAAPLDTTVAIETPEHVAFEYRVAGPARRSVAHVLDLLLCYGGFALVAFVVVVAAIGTSFATELSGIAKASVGLLLVMFFFVHVRKHISVELVCVDSFEGDDEVRGIPTVRFD